MRNIFWLCIGAMVISSCSKPIASFELSIENTNETPVTASFTNTSTDCDSYIWYFGDGNTATEENPTHNFLTFGDVPVVLEGRKGNKISRDTQVINIPEPPRKKVRIVTPFGEMVAELFNTTPNHRDNFLRLANDQFYNDLLFHRVIDGFMIQGGDPDSRNAPPLQQLGLGGPGYTLEAEIGESHYKGALAAARKGDQLNPERASSGSQFYIVDGKTYSSIELANLGSQLGMTFTEEQKQNYARIGGTPFLDNQYTVFGQVIEGMEVIDKITAVETNSTDRPEEDIPMEIFIIQENI